MPKFRISYTTEDWWRLDVEANTIDEAMEKFHTGWWKHDDAAMIEGGYLQDSVEIHPLED
jgi:hypothetical protein